MTEFSRRKEDTARFQITHLVKIITTCAVIGGAFFWLGGTKWQTREEATVCHERLQAQITSAQLDAVRVQTLLETIDKRTQRIEERLK
jgi:hypothetical protein